MGSNAHRKSYDNQDFRVKKRTILGPNHKGKLYFKVVSTMLVFDGKIIIFKMI